MAKINIKDLSPFLSYDETNFKYEVKKDISNIEYHIKHIIERNLNNNIINIPTISEVLLECYPFIEKTSKDVIKNLVDRNNRIRKLVINSIKNRKHPKIYLEDTDEKDLFIKDLAKSIIHDLNKILYKYEITQIFTNKTFVNYDEERKFIGTIDVLLTNSQEWFIVSFKASRSGYTKKYFAELFLQKELFELNTKYKIAEMIVLNPRDQIEIKQYEEPSKYEKNIINTYFSK